MQIKRLLATICVFFALTQCTSTLEPERAGQENFLTRAVYADGRLWVLSDEGVLSSLIEGERAWVHATLTDPVFGICRTQDGDLFAVTGKRENADQWTVRRWHDDAWSTETDIPAIDEHPFALDCGAGDVTLLTSRRIVDIGGKTTDVSWPKQGLRGRITSFLGTPGAVFIGVNAGEWGGGLYRLDRKTGEIVSIERNVSGALCGGPLNRECDPVNALAALPWKPDCAAVAIGLVHLSEHGRIVEVCGGEVTRLYYGADPGAVAMGKGMDEPFETVAFFGLASSSDAIWAFGADKLYRIDKNGDATNAAMPAFEKIGNIQVSFALPDFVLVLTEVGQRNSLSDSTPILVPR
jgi:hypothetical protein